jgi:hypothetical protein
MLTTVFLDVIRLEHRERIRLAERDRLAALMERANHHESVLKSVLASLRRGQ